MTKIFLLTRVILKSFQKKKEDSSLCHALLFGHALLHFVMLLLTYSTPRTRILSSTTHSSRFGDKNWNLLFTCYYSKCDPIQKHRISSWQKYCFWQGSFWRLFKRKRKILHYAMLHFLVMLCYILSCFSWHILLQGQEFWVLQLILHVLGTKFEIYYSPVTIHYYYSLSLFTRYCSLRIFAYLRGVIPYISSKF